MKARWLAEARCELTEMTGAGDEITALVADDHDFTRMWLSERLPGLDCRPRIGRVVLAATAGDAVRMVPSLKPDLIFLDIEFSPAVPAQGPETEEVLDGLEAARRIWKAHGDVKIVVVTSHASESYLRRLAEVTPDGACFGYVLKEHLVSVLEESVASVLAGDCWVDPSVSAIRRKQNKQGFELADNLYEVLVCIALGLSDQTASKVLYICEQAVQFRLRKLYAHFGIPPKGDPLSGQFNSRSRAVRLATERGLINETDLKLWAAKLQKRADEQNLPIGI